MTYEPHRYFPIKIEQQTASQKKARPAIRSEKQNNILKPNFGFQFSPEAMARCVLFKTPDQFKRLVLRLHTSSTFATSRLLTAAYSFQPHCCAENILSIKKLF
jgi:hypothetical protein